MRTPLPIDRRIRLLIDSMTLREKVGQLNQRMFGWNAYIRKGEGIELTAAFHDEVARWDGMGALYGLFRADPWAAVTHETGILARQSARAANVIQRHVREHTRLGIPVLLSEECPHGHMALDGTLLPTGVGVASAWAASVEIGVPASIRMTSGLYKEPGQAGAKGRRGPPAIALHFRSQHRVPFYLGRKPNSS